MSSYDHWIAEFEARQWQKKRGRGQPMASGQPSSSGLPDTSSCSGPGGGNATGAKCTPSTSFVKPSPSSHNISQNNTITRDSAFEPRPHYTPTTFSSASASPAPPALNISSSETRKRMGGGQYAKPRLPGDKQKAPELHATEAQPTQGPEVYGTWQVFSNAPASTSRAPIVIPSSPSVPLLNYPTLSPQLQGRTSPTKVLVYNQPATPTHAPTTTYISAPTYTSPTYLSTTPLEPGPPSHYAPPRPQSPNGARRHTSSPTRYYTTPTNTGPDNYDSQPRKLMIVPAYDEFSSLRSTSPPASMFPSGRRDSLPQPLADRTASPTQPYSPLLMNRSGSPPRTPTESALDSSLLVAGSPLRRRKVWEDNNAIARSSTPI